MKKLLSLLLSLTALGLVAAPAEAILYDRGGGLIYDTDLNITWLQDANYAMTSGYDADGLMTWSDTVTWADTLVYGGYSDWRLPTVVPQNYNWGSDGTTGAGYNITTGSEMGHLFYTELGNKGIADTSGFYVGDGNYGLNNAGPFINFQMYTDVYGFDWLYPYWSGTEYAPDTFHAWGFDFSTGTQGLFYGYHEYQGMGKGVPLLALAVRDGDVAGTTSGGGTASVPEPGTMMLVGSGLVGLIAARKRFSRRHG